MPAGPGRALLATIAALTLAAHPARAAGLAGTSTRSGEVDVVVDEAHDELPPTSTSTPAQKRHALPPWPAINLYSLLAADDLATELVRRHRQQGPFPELLERLTRGLVAAPYVLSPLGEGAGVDQDPRFRLDAFDCTTLVETALALARCDSVAEIALELDRIRYQGAEITYDKRRHLVTAQWIPGLISAGYLEDITREVGEAKEIALVLDAARWKRRRVARTVALAPESVPEGTYFLSYLPLKTALARAKAVPPGTIIDIVRSDWAYSPEVITHQGLVLARPGDGQLFVRHASPIARRVIDEPLVHMLERYLSPKLPKAWPVVGVNYLRVVEPKAATAPGGAKR